MSKTIPLSIKLCSDLLSNPVSRAVRQGWKSAKNDKKFLKIEKIAIIRINLLVHVCSTKYSSSVRSIKLHLENDLYQL